VAVTSVRGSICIGHNLCTSISPASKQNLSNSLHWKLLLNTKFQFRWWDWIKILLYKQWLTTRQETR